ncbi:MAG: glycoside hydrolase family 130 protein [Ignavibacteriales bacterium]
MTKLQDIRLTPDPSKVLMQFFFPGNERRVSNILERIYGLSEKRAKILLQDVIESFSDRHRNIRKSFESNFRNIKKYIAEDLPLSAVKKMLIGAYFSKEYSIESAALFNPSIVLHPEQDKNTGTKFILSLRATGEGHISSIEFRTGIVDKKGEIRLEPASSFASSGMVSNDGRNLDEGYEIKFDRRIPLSERVLFPASDSESHGMEDARMVRFQDEDSSAVYYGTYTAYNGRNTSIRMVETKDFINFKITSLKGKAVKDKGMALFPRKVNGKYMMISRQDGENLFFMQSDDIYTWDKMKLLRMPFNDWEFIQVGNCGSPIETEAGWILLTHGVGPVRTYVISAILLDLKDPSRVIAYLPDPIITASEQERNGYVPNVVYSCGSILHNGRLIVPYAMADSASGIAVYEVDELLKRFVKITEQ